nr:cg30 [Calliteara abietis nucleopolyhedrovirus]
MPSISLSCCVCLAISTLNCSEDDQDDFVILPLVTLANCMHKICLNCVKKLKKNRIAACPLCRTESSKVCLLSLNRSNVVVCEFALVNIKDAFQLRSNLHDYIRQKYSSCIETDISAASTSAAAPTSTADSATVSGANNMTAAAAASSSSLFTTMSAQNSVIEQNKEMIENQNRIIRDNLSILDEVNRNIDTTKARYANQLSELENLIVRKNHVLKQIEDFKNVEIAKHREFDRLNVEIKNNYVAIKHKINSDMKNILKPWKRQKMMQINRIINSDSDDFDDDFDDDNDNNFNMV